MGNSVRGATSIKTLSFEDFFQVEVGGQVKRAALLLGSTEEANDVVQDAFVRVYQRWDEIDDPGPYLNRTVLNLCRDLGRARTRRLVIERMLPRDAVSIRTEDSLTDVLARLPFNHRAAIVLRFWAGLSTDEIADQLGCKPGSVGPWITRGLRALRKELT